MSVSALWLESKFTDGYEMTHIASRGMGEVPYFFQGHASKFKVSRTEKLTIWIWFGQDY